MKTMKRFLSLLLLASLLTAMFVPATYAEQETVTGKDVHYSFNLLVDYAQYFNNSNGTKLSKVESTLEGLYPNTINWNYETGSNKSDQVELRNTQGLRLKAGAGDWIAFRLSGITAGTYEFTLTSSGNTTMNLASIYLVKATAGLDIAGSMTAENMLIKETAKGGGVYSPAGPIALESSEYFLIIKHTKENASKYICLTSLSLKAVAGGPVVTQPVETTTAATTVPETTAPEGTATQQFYDFELYNNQTVNDAIVNGTLAGVNTNLYTQKYNAAGDRLYEWFFSGSGSPNGYGNGLINWRPEASNGYYDIEKDSTGNEMKNFSTRGSANGGMQLTLVHEGYGLSAGQLAAFRIRVTDAGYYEVKLTAGQVSSSANVYIFPALTEATSTTNRMSDMREETEYKISTYLTQENKVATVTLTSNQTVTAGYWTIPAAGEYIVVFQIPQGSTKDIYLDNLILVPAVEGEEEEPTEPSVTTEPSQSTEPSVPTDPSQPGEEYEPVTDTDGIFDFNVIVTYPQLCGGLNTRHYKKKVVDPSGKTVYIDGKDITVEKYLEHLYKQETIDWVLEDYSFQNGAALENIELRSAQGLRIYGQTGDYLTFRLKVPTAGIYNLMLTSGGSNNVDLYLAEAAADLDVVGAMIPENLLTSDVKAAAKAAIAQEVALEAKDYILMVKFKTGSADTYWTLAQLALEVWTPKQAKPATDKMVYDFDLVSMDGQFVKKSMTNRYVEGGIRVSAKIGEMYAADQIRWMYENASESFPIKEFTFRQYFYRLKAETNTKKLSDPWVAFRIKNPGTDTYDVRLISGDKSQVCVNVYLIPAPSTLTLTAAQIKEGMNEDNLLVKNAQIDEKNTFYLGEYAFGLEDEYVLVFDFIKGGALFLSQIEMTRDGLLADGTIKHGKSYSGVVYDLDLADQMDGVYSDSTVYANEVIDDMNARWYSGELNWKWVNASQGLSGTTTSTKGLPTNTVRFYRATGMRLYGTPNAWAALKIKSPGSGDFTISLNHATCANSGTIAVYILPADTDPDNIWTATDPENRVGKVVLTNETGSTAVVDGSTSFVGYWNFEAGKEYIIVFECYEGSTFNSKRCYMNLSQIIMQKGIIKQEEKDAGKKVTAMTVAPAALPIADAGTYAAITEVNGHDYYFLPVEGGYMLVYDLDTGKLVEKVNTGISRSGDVVVTKDGKIVLAKASSFVYDPITGEGYYLTNWQNTPGLENAVDPASLCIDSDGRTMWMGATYGAYLAKYDFVDKDYTYLGQPYGYQNRITGIIRLGDYLFGCAHGDGLNKIFKWDIAEGKVVADYDVSAVMGTASYIHSLNILGNGDYICAGGSNLTAAIVLNPETMEPVDLGMFAIPNIGITEIIDGKQYMVLQKLGLYEYDVETKTVSKVPGFGTSGIGFRTGAQKSYGKSTVTINGEFCIMTYTSDGGHPRLFNMVTNEYQAWDNLVTDGGGGSDIRTLLSWGEGSNRFSFGGFNTNLCAVYNTELGGIEFYYKTGGQTDSHVWYDGKLYAGNYSSTTLNEIYPDENNTSLPATNEYIQRWQLEHEGDMQQKRIHILTAGDGYVFAGTTPNSNYYGGGIVTYDTRTGRWNFDRSPVVNGSINGLAYHDKLLYATTSNTGGSGGTAPDGTSAVLFVYDYENREVLATLDPRDYISGLASPVWHIRGVFPDPNVDENGRFWSVVSETLFCFTFDRETKTFDVQEVASYSKTLYNTSSSNGWWPRHIEFDTENNYLYVNFDNMGGMRRIELEDWDAPIGSVKVKNSDRFMADIPFSNFWLIGDDGNLYYAINEDIKMFPLNLTDEDWAIAKQVDDQILSIGSEITVESEAAIKTARSAYENLSWRYKSLIQNLEILQEAESDLLERKIDTYDGVEMTADHFPEMTELMNVYKAMSSRQQRYVKNYSKLKTAYGEASDLNDQRVAAAMQERINALGEKFPLTLENEPEVLELRTAYKELTAKQSSLLDETILLDAEAQIKALRAELVVEVEKLIQAIPAEITMEAEPAILAAREGADKLYTNERKNVSYSKLTSAEGKLRTLKNAKAKADPVVAMIDAIGTVWWNDAQLIAEARAAYEALSGSERSFVTNYETLVAAEERLLLVQTWGVPVIAGGSAILLMAAALVIFRKKIFKGKKKAEATE